MPDMEVIEIPIIFDVVEIPFPKRVRKINQVTVYLGNHVFRSRGGRPEECVNNILILLENSDFPARITHVVKEAILGAVVEYLNENQS